MLSLAARHRVVPHIIRYSGADFRFEEWRNPLCRQRGVTEEDAAGPLIDPADLEAYFEYSASWWIGLNPDQKDAVRLAIFGINRLAESTMESNFMGKFSALEGSANAGVRAVQHGKSSTLCLKSTRCILGDCGPCLRAMEAYRSIGCGTRLRTVAR